MRVTREVQKAFGVYETPPRVVRAQVRLVVDVLANRLGIARQFADERVVVVDPATGSGAYPLALIDLVGEDAESLSRRMYLFETLHDAADVARARGLSVREADALATKLELDAPVVVCLGNPPYLRGTRATRHLPDAFVSVAGGIHTKNIYNAYVYFWAWALATLFERRCGPGLVSLVTASSYLRGPAFDGMRATLRRLLDELWIVDLEGDRLAARQTHNVFPIRTPVAIAMGVRYGAARPEQPALVHYVRLNGDREAKLAALDRAGALSDVRWTTARSDWAAPLVSVQQTGYQSWPRLTDLFPWQLCGAQLKRTWPIGPTPDVLRERWRYLLTLDEREREAAFGVTRDRGLSATPRDLIDPDTRLTRLATLPSDEPSMAPARYAYRSFDRQWVLPDARLGDFMRPALWRIAGPGQLFLTSLLTNVLGPGPALVATAHVPDLDHFRGSFGARAVIPLWSDDDGSTPNVARGCLAALSGRLGVNVDVDMLVAYCYALLGGRAYVARFSEELRVPGPRVPLTRDATLFSHAVMLGRHMLDVHTYRRVESGKACLAEPIGPMWPRAFDYDTFRERLTIGDGVIEGVAHDVWAYEVSGMLVLRGWLRRRIGPHRHRTILDDIRPTRWTAELSRELLELLWLLEATVAIEADLAQLLDQIVSSSRGEGAWAARGREQAGHVFGLHRACEDVALALVAPELLEHRPL